MYRHSLPTWHDPEVPKCDFAAVGACVPPQAVQAFIRTHGRPPVVLDIGCGTGLLSMLAARAGAEEVYGCEMYKPLAQIAREVTELNCKGKVKVPRERTLDDATILFANATANMPSVPLRIWGWRSRSSRLTLSLPLSSCRTSILLIPDNWQAKH